MKYIKPAHFMTMSLGLHAVFERNRTDITNTTRFTH